MNTGSILFDILFKAKETNDGRIVVKMDGGSFVDCSEIPKLVKKYYRYYETAIREDLEATGPL